MMVVKIGREMARKGDCKICKDGVLRARIATLLVEGLTPWYIHKKLKTEGISCAIGLIQHHLEEHEKSPTLWCGLVKSKFGSEDERKSYETSLLNRISIVTEIVDKYQVLNELFELVVGKPGAINEYIVAAPEKVTKLAGEMRAYLEDLLKLQKERDLVVEVAKVVLYMCAGGLIERLRYVVADMPLERRVLVGQIIKEEVERALEYAKGISKGKMDDMFSRVNEEYEKLVKGESK